MEDEEKLRVIAANLSPERPIRSSEFLRGRMSDLERIERELRYFHAVPFIYGHRGVGKTSLARTAAQMVTKSDREHVYVACAPGSRMMKIFREISEGVMSLVLKLTNVEMMLKSVDVQLSVSPSIKTSFECRTPKIDDFDDPAAAVRVIRELSALLPDSETTVVVLDELEELDENDRSDLAYFVKQLGDQEIKLKFILVGIAQNVHELISAHESVPRYLKEISLLPLPLQPLIDIVENAAKEVGATVPRSILFRIAIIGNGFPHFPHLMGKALLVEAVLANENYINDAVYKKGVASAVADSIEELRVVYETATQRSEDYYKHLIWALAQADVVDIRVDEWVDLYHELAARFNWQTVEERRLKNAIGNFKNVSYGKIVVNTPARYGSVEMRYRYKRFASALMKGQVRLSAENEGVKLGRETGM